MAKIHFFTQTVTTDKNALVPIYVRLKWGQKIDVVCKADILTKPDNWSNETEQARQRSDGFKIKSDFNNKISELRKAIESELGNIHQSDLVAMLQDRDPAK